MRLRVSILVFLMLSTQGQTKFWRCEDKQTLISTITETPVQSNSTHCLPLDLSRAAVSSYPKAFSATFGTAAKEESARKYPPGELEQRQKNRASMSSISVHLTWKNEETAEYNPRAFGKVEVKCRFVGEVAGALSRPVTIVIERGGATRDEHTLILRRGHIRVPWKLTLKGPCRNARVTVKNRGN